jgi:hypothetical protein
MKLNEVLLNARNTLQSVKLHAGRGGLGEAHLDIHIFSYELCEVELGGD